MSPPQHLLVPHLVSIREVSSQSSARRPRLDSSSIDSNFHISNFQIDVPGCFHDDVVRCILCQASGCVLTCGTSIGTSTHAYVPSNKTKEKRGKGYTRRFQEALARRRASMWKKGFRAPASDGRVRNSERRFAGRTVVPLTRGKNACTHEHRSPRSHLE